MHVAKLITSEYDPNGLSFEELAEFVEIIKRDHAGEYWPHGRVIIRADDDMLCQIAIQHDPTRGLGGM